MTKAELILRRKAGEKADEIVASVRTCPDWFSMQGGSDGTFGNAMFHADYGHLLPEISRFAEECGGVI